MWISYPHNVYKDMYKLTYYRKLLIKMWINNKYVYNLKILVKTLFIIFFTHYFHTKIFTYPQVIHKLWILLCKLKLIKKYVDNFFK